MTRLSMIDIGERAGSSIPNIYHVWKEQGWAEPVFRQSFDPDRTVLSLAFSKTSDKNEKQAIKIDDKRISERQKDTIIEYLTDHAEAKTAEIA